jgi:hypothetical protein
MHALKDKKWDTLVIDGGHNCLRTSTYLARTSLFVAFLKHCHFTRGGRHRRASPTVAVTEELVPCFKFSSYNYL